jgi:hypothetical protein
MKMISFKGTDYLFPLSDRFRRHTADEFDALVASLREHGLKHPILLYRTAEDEQPRILDGQGRLSAAAHAGDVKVRFEHLGTKTDDEAYELAKVYNDHRRQNRTTRRPSRNGSRIGSNGWPQVERKGSHCGRLRSRKGCRSVRCKGISPKQLYRGIQLNPKR